MKFCDIFLLFMCDNLKVRIKLKSNQAKLALKDERRVYLSDSGKKCW